MKKFIVLYFLFIVFAFCLISCSDSSSDSGDGITITSLGWVIENIDSSFWYNPPQEDAHAFYDFFIRYEGNISASDISSAIVATPTGIYFDLNRPQLIDTQNRLIGGWTRCYILGSPDCLPIGNFTAEVMLNNGARSTFSRIIPAPGSMVTNGYEFVHAPEYSSCSNSTPLVRKAENLNGSISGSKITIEFTINDSLVYNGCVWFYDNAGYYLGGSIKMFRDANTGDLTAIIDNLNTAGSVNTVTLEESDITFQQGAMFEQISKFIVALTDGWQYYSQARYTVFDCQSVSAKTSF